MKRLVTYFRKPERTTIQGVANAAMIQVLPGQRCTGSANFGGGYVGEMVLRDGLIEIHKVDEQGKPVRNFGVTKITTTRGQVDAIVEGDFVAVPAAQCFGVVVREVEEPGDVKAVASDPKLDAIVDGLRALKEIGLKTYAAQEAVALSALKDATEKAQAPVAEKVDLNQPAKALPKAK